MSVLEIIALHADDAERAEAGGADRVELVETMDDDGLSPKPQMVEEVRRRTSIQMRPMVRLRAGFGTDGKEIGRLRGLIASFLDAGADGVVLGFLDQANHVDRQVVAELVGDGDFPWTFHRAIDNCRDVDRAWEDVLALPRVNQVLTAGSPRGVEYGLDDLLRRSTADPAVAKLIMAGGGLQVEHVPPLIDAGVRAFHVGSRVRPGGSFEARVDDQLVRNWRTQIDEETARMQAALP